MELQAEGADADAVQPLLHHLQGRHLLRHEEDPLALGQGVCDEGGDGLGFAGAGRAVEDEALPGAGGLDGIKLGGVGGHGQQDAVLRHPRPHFQGPGVPGQPALHEAAHHLVAQQVFGAVADVVPHDELGEGEDADAGGLQHVPAGLVHDGLAHDGQHPADVHAVVVAGQGVHPVDQDAVVLLQLLQQGDIHLGIIVPQPDHIALGGGFADDLDGQQDDGGVAGLGAAPGLEPAQQAQGHI